MKVYQNVRYYDGKNLFTWYIPVYHSKKGAFCYIDGGLTWLRRAKGSSFDGYEVVR